LKRGHQLLVFVHSRTRTEKMSGFVVEKLAENELLWYVRRKDHENYDEVYERVV